jgi:serine/threonine protein kinase
VFFSIDGSRFEGQHVNGVRQGHGSVVLGAPLQGQYTGEFRNGRPHGKITYDWLNGMSFTGYNEGGRPTRGVLKDTDGRKYDVTYSADCGLFWNNRCKAIPDVFGPLVWPRPPGSQTHCGDAGPPPEPLTKEPTQEQCAKDERELQSQREEEEQRRRQREEEEQRRRQREEEEQLRRQREEEEQRKRQAASALVSGGPPCEVPTESVITWTSNFSDEKKIGEGAFGDVFEGALDINQRQVRVAVKRLKPSIRLQGDETEHRAALSGIRREIHVLSTFFHPNIIRLLGYTSTSAGMTEEMCLIYELGQCGSLEKMLVDAENVQDLSWRSRVRVAAGISRALNYLHCHDPRAPAYHRDVKSANIVLDFGFSPKLIDCGLSKFIPNEQRFGTIMSTRGAVLGTPGYMCPTYQRTGKYEAKSEIFSFGIVLLELLTGRIQGYQQMPENDLYGVYIEDESPLGDNLDTRAGTWSAESADELEKLVRECVATHKRRIASMLAVMRRLVRLEKEFCQATPEERRLTRLTEDLQCELEALRLQAERQQAAHQEAQRECVVCYDQSPQGVGCEGPSSHFICSDCAPRQVQTILQQISPGAYASDQRLECHRAQGGRIKCVLPDCEAFYSETWLARALPDDVFRQYRAAQDEVVEQRLFVQLQERFQEDLAAARAEFQSSSRTAQTAQDEAATEEFMRRQYPNAVQCPTCGAGPVIPENCYDLQAHHGESTRGGRISNACPSCGFFSRERGDWIRWNGRMR